MKPVTEAEFLAACDAFDAAWGDRTKAVAVRHLKHESARISENVISIPVVYSDASGFFQADVDIVTGRVVAD